MRWSPPFWTLVNKTETCWLWKGVTQTKGYGVYKGKLAHRVSFSLENGKVTKDDHIHHTCCNKLCVNPTHLVATTASLHPDAAPNFQRTKTHCIHGHEYTPENTYINSHTKGRVCRICQQVSHIQTKIFKEAIKWQK